jgi:hypothetical protein
MRHIPRQSKRKNAAPSVVKAFIGHPSVTTVHAGFLVDFIVILIAEVCHCCHAIAMNQQSRALIKIDM